MIHKPNHTSIAGAISFAWDDKVSVLTRIKLGLAQNNLLALLHFPKANEANRNVSLDSAFRRTESDDRDDSLVGFWEDKY